MNCCGSTKVSQQARNSSHCKTPREKQQNDSVSWQTWPMRGDWRLCDFLNSKCCEASVTTIFHYGKLLSGEGDKTIHLKTGQEGLNCSKENFAQMLAKSFCLSRRLRTEINCQGRVESLSQEGLKNRQLINCQAWLRSNCFCWGRGLSYLTSSVTTSFTCIDQSISRGTEPSTSHTNYRKLEHE